MAPDHLGIHVRRDILDVELARIGRNLTLQHYLQQHIAKLLAHMGNVARLDGIDRFVGFLDHVVGNGRVRLLAIPWAAIRRAKRRYRGHELVERGMMLRMRRPFKRVLMLRCRHAMLLLSSSIN